MAIKKDHDLSQVELCSFSVIFPIGLCFSRGAVDDIGRRAIAPKQKPVSYDLGGHILPYDYSVRTVHLAGERLNQNGRKRTKHIKIALLLVSGLIHLKRCSQIGCSNLTEVSFLMTSMTRYRAALPHMFPYIYHGSEFRLLLSVFCSVREESKLNQRAWNRRRGNAF